MTKREYVESADYIYVACKFADSGWLKASAEFALDNLDKFRLSDFDFEPAVPDKGVPSFLWIGHFY